MTSQLQSLDALARLLGDLQRRAHTLHGDVANRSLRAKIRALSIQMRHISATLTGTGGVLAQIIASELIEAVQVVIQQLEGDAQRRPHGAQ